jgi:glycosyltransferase involved in cell wall biosynthesis
LYPPAIYGGGEYIFFQWAKELAKRGHKVYVITQRLVRERDFEIIEGIRVYRVGPAIKYRGLLPLGVFENFGYIIGAIMKGVTLISKNNINIIHSNTYAPALAGQACAIIFRRNHIITVHDVYFSVIKNFWKKWASQASLSGSVGKIGPLIERIVFRLPAKIFHTVSETSKEDLSAYGLHKVIVINNGIDLREYDSIINTELVPHQAVFIGRLVFYKNLDTVIKSMKSIVARIPNSRLIVVGDGPMRPSLEKLIEDLGLTNNVVIKGRVSHEEKVWLLKQSAFLVLPSVVEGFGIVLLEAFACRKPVIVSRVKPLTEIIENDSYGYVIPPFNVDAWAEKMIDLFNDPNKATKMGICGREELEKSYIIPKVVDKLEELYSKITTCER